MYVLCIKKHVRYSVMSFCGTQIGYVIFVQPDIKAIKKRMEDLITRDYLERDKENANMFRYLA